METKTITMNARTKALINRVGAILDNVADTANLTCEPGDEDNSFSWILYPADTANRMTKKQLAIFVGAMNFFDATAGDAMTWNLYTILRNSVRVPAFFVTIDKTAYDE